MPFEPTKINRSTAANAVDAKRTAMEAAKTSNPSSVARALTKYIKPSDCVDRTRIVFDDSGSMSGWPIANAKQGVVEFLRNCIPNQSAVAVHFMNTPSWGELTSDLPQLAINIQEAELRTGGTPFFNTLKKALEATPRLTRLVAFTDGAPTDSLKAEGDGELQACYRWRAEKAWLESADIIITLSKATKPEIPIDTVFIGSRESSSNETELLKYLSDKTGGFFLHFDPAKPNIWKQLKYLAPVNRLRLSSGEFRATVEKGETR